MTGRVVWIAALLPSLALPASAAGGEVPLYGTAEIALAAASTCDGTAGEPDPFDLEVTAQVTSPSARRFAVPGFFDGDGEGGPAGRIFKVRVAAGEIGVWHWRTESGVPGLDG